MYHRNIGQLYIKLPTYVQDDIQSDGGLGRDVVGEAVHYDRPQEVHYVLPGGVTRQQTFTNQKRNTLNLSDSRL